MLSRGKARDCRGTRALLIGIMVLGLLAGTIPIVVSAYQGPSPSVDDRHVQEVSEGFAPAPSKSIAVTSVQNFTPDLVLSPLFYGVNVRTDDPFNQSDADALASAGALTWRFPGGQIGESYNYTTNTRNTTGAFEPNSISNFAALCESVHCNAILQLPAEVDNPATDAYYVEFVEQTLHFTPAIWEFGNEPALWTNFRQPWVDWNTTGTNATPGTYAAIVPSIISAIRSVDSTTPIDPLGGVGGGSKGDYVWVRDVMSAAQTTAQYISIHSYIGENTNVANASSFYTPLYGSPYALNVSIPRLYATILAACAACTNVGLLVSEAGASTGGTNGNFERSFSMDMWDAVEVIQAADAGLTSIDFFAFDNGYAGSWIVAPATTFDPAYYLFKDVTPLLGSTVLNVTLNRTDNGMLKVGAWWGGEDNWSLLLVNLDTQNATTVNLTSSGFPVHGNIDDYVWNGSTTQPVGQAFSWLNVTTVEPNSMELITVNFALPSSPTGLSVSGNSPFSISLSWTPPGGLESNATVYLANYSEGACRTFSIAYSAGPVATYTVQGLPSTNEYCFEVTEWNGAGQSLPSVRLQATTIPFAPGSPSVTTDTPTSLNVSWTNPSGTLTGNYVFWEAGSSCYAAAEIDVGLVATSYIVTDLTTNTLYCFYVQAVDPGGNSSSSSIITGVTSSVPSGPTGLTLGTVTTTTVLLTWTNPATVDLVNDTVYYKAESSCGPGMTGLSMEGPVTSYTVGSLSGATPYAIEVTAWNATGQSPDSSCVEATTLPTLPTQVMASPASTTSITVTWTNPSGTLTDDYVYWQAGSSCGSATKFDIGSVVATFTRTSLTSGAQYCFYVQAVSAGGASAFSSIVTATTNQVPVRPSGLSVTAFTTTTVSLSWTNPSGGGITNDTVYEQLCSRGMITGLSTGGVATTYTASSLTSNVCYSFYVTAWNASGQSAGSGAVSQLTAVVPAAPTSVTVGVVTTTTIALTWTNPNTGLSVNETVYYKAEPSCSGTMTAVSIGSAATTYTITGLLTATEYAVEVAIWNASGPSPDSSCVSGTTLPVNPTSLSVTTTATTATVTWTVPSGAVVNETVYWGAICGTYPDSASAGPVRTTYTISGLVPETSYCFIVTAWSAGGQSAPAPSVSGTTLSISPTISGAPPAAWFVWIVAGTVVIAVVAVVAAILLVRRRRKSTEDPSQSPPPPTSPPGTN